MVKIIPYREEMQSNGVTKIHSINIIGNGHEILLRHEDIPDWSKDNEPESSFYYKGHLYFLSEFMRTSGFLKEHGFDGISNDTYFSGVLIKICDDTDYIKVYTFFS